MVVNAGAGDARLRADEVLRIMRDRLDSGDFDETLFADDPVRIVERMTSSLGRTHPASGRIGPVYTTASLTAWKGVSKQALQNAVRQHRLIGFKTADNTWLYPAYQFGSRGEYLPDLPRLFPLLDPTGTDVTTPVVWLNQQHSEWGGLTGAEMLRAGRVAEIIPAASEIRTAWAD